MSITAVLPPPSSFEKSDRSFFPVIADSSLEPFGRGAVAEGSIRHSGLLAGSDLSAAVFSMSDYGKAAYPDAKNYHTTQPLQSAMYVAYPQSGVVQPHLQSHPMQYARSPDQYAAGPLFQTREARNESSSTYLSGGSRQIPEVASWSPQQGSPGTTVFIFLMSAFELDPSWKLEVEFGTRRCNTTIRRVEAQSLYYQYALSSEVPSFAVTDCTSAQVPVNVVAQDQSGYEIASVKLEPGFLYTDTVLSQLPQELSKKRRLSTESAEASSAPLKRTATMPHTRTESRDSYDGQRYNYSGTYVQPSPQLSLDTSITHGLPAYQRAQTHSADVRQDSPQRLPPQIHSATPTSAPARRRSPGTPSWSISTVNGGQLTNSPMTGPTNSRVAALASPSVVNNPPLIRTSTLQQSPSPASTPSGATTQGTFNPYAMYPHKAILKITGSLDSMIEGWKEEEKETKRRLVQFWRSQTGSTITTNFKPVAPEDRQPNSICISCIWWEARNEYYVTSVDTIYLLESLVAVRFTVEEKNRIRRNLEGFRPMTVSKGKSDSEDFFKLIMGFPNPKPRNIEKDVKVFPWKILSHALKKIISKYSASYSSTAGALPPSMNSSFRNPQTQDLSSELLPASPHSNADSTISVAYHSPMTATTMSSEVQHAHTTSPYASASPAVMPVTMAPGYPLYSYPHSQLNHPTASIGIPTSQAPQHHQSPSQWHIAPYMEPTTIASAHGLYAVGAAHDSSQYQMTSNTSSGA